MCILKRGYKNIVVRDEEPDLRRSGNITVNSKETKMGSYLMMVFNDFHFKTSIPQFKRMLVTITVFVSVKILLFIMHLH